MYLEDEELLMRLLMRWMEKEIGSLR